MKCSLVIVFAFIGAALSAPQSLFGPAYVVSTSGGPTYTVTNSQRGFSIENGGSLPATIRSGGVYSSQSAVSQSAAFAAQQLAAEQAAAQRYTADQVVAQRYASEQASAQRYAAEQASAQRLAAEQAAAHRSAAAQRVAVEQASSQRYAAEQAAAHRAAAAQRVAVDQASSQRYAAEQAAAHRAAAAQRVAVEQASSQKYAAEQAAAQRAAAQAALVQKTAYVQSAHLDAAHLSGPSYIAGSRSGLQNAYIIRQTQDLADDGSVFNFGYETDNGIAVQSQGTARSFGPAPDDQILSVSGSYSYVGDDGQTYTVNYVADENGFQPQGAHLHPVPEEIQRSIQYNLANPHPETIIQKK